MLDFFIKHTRKRACGYFFKTSPRLAGQAQLDVLIIHLHVERYAGPFAEQNERWFSQSRASLLVEGFEIP